MIFGKTTVHLLLFRVYLSSFLKLKYLVQLLWFRISLRSFLRLKYMSQKSLNKASTFTAGSIAASTVILAATLTIPRVSTTLAAPTICDAPTALSAASFTTVAAHKIWDALLHSQLLPLLYFQQVCEEMSIESSVSWSLVPQLLLQQICEELSVQSSVYCLKIILFFSSFYNRSVKSCLYKALSMSQDYLVLQLLLQQIWEDLSVKSSVFCLKVILIFSCFITDLWRAVCKEQRLLSQYLLVYLILYPRYTSSPLYPGYTSSPLYPGYTSSPLYPGYTSSPLYPGYPSPHLYPGLSSPVLCPGYPSSSVCPEYPSSLCVLDILVFSCVPWIS